MTPERKRALEIGSRLLGGALNEASIELAAERVRETIDAALFDVVDAAIFGGKKMEKQHVTVHRTFANGMQMGYGRDGNGFRIFSRPNPKKPWTELGQWDLSWVVLADRISKLSESDEDET